MQYIDSYTSPLGKILLASDEIGLCGLWFEDQGRYDSSECYKKHLPVFESTKKWLDTYFSGAEPSFTLPLHFIGTDFQVEVWKALCTVSYGKTLTYGEIARALAEKRGIPRMSAQAVGGAVARNKISIIVPCHRIVGVGGALVGYAGGIERKKALLKLESAIEH